LIDRDWLYEQYVTHRRTLTDLAREVGVSVSQMSRDAKAYEIPITPGKVAAMHASAEQTQ
jgi:hypothetical protein